MCGGARRRRKGREVSRLDVPNLRRHSMARKNDDSAHVRYLLAVGKVA